MGSLSLTETGGAAEVAHVPMTKRKVANLAAPIVAEYLLQTLVAAVSTLLISQAGDTALAGVGIANPIIFFFLALFSAVSVGATVLISKAFGAGDTARVNHVARQALIWGLVLSAFRCRWPRIS